MNPLLDFEKERGPGGVFHGMPEGTEPDPTKALMGAASSMGGLLAGMRETAPGSLRRAWEGSVLRDKLQEGLNTAAYYAGPHLSNRAEAVANVIPSITPKFGTEDATAAGEAFKAGKMGRGASLMGLGVAGGLLDALPGEAVAKGLLKGITKAAHYTPDLSMAVAPIKAFHGSPFDFEKFDIKKIGAGEGAQAYGHGLYFAEKPTVARGYRDRLTGREYDTTAGRKTYQDMITDMAEATRAATPNMALINRDRVVDDVLGGIDEMGSASRYLKNYEMPTAAHKAALQVALDLKAKPYKGRMYEVGIHADPEKLLDWDRPLSAQSAPVQKALTKLGVAGERAIPYGEMRDSFINPMREATKGTDVGRFVSPEDLLAGKADLGEVRKSLEPDRLARVDALLEAFKGRSSLRGGDAYKGLARTYENDVTGLTSAPRSVDASEQLRDLGVPGIRYLDQGSRGAGEGSRNYVAFSDDIVEILRKYGLAGAGVGLGGAMAMQPGLFPLPQQQ